MKKNIHPEYHKNAKITCSCGTVFEIGSTKTAIRIELCSNCHPFYTGEQKIVDTAKRVEKFQARTAKAKEVGGAKKGKTAKRAAKKEKRASKEKTVKEK